jgi:hypothetical protein
MSTQPEPPDVERYVWFDYETAGELCKQLTQAGPGCRLEIHKRQGQTWLHVVPEGMTREAAAEPFQPLNKSHLCPPDCPAP